MLTLKETIAHIKQAGYPYYRLKGRADSWTDVRTNIGENLTDENPTVDAVIDKVKKHVEMFSKNNPTYVFELELLRTPSSTKGGVLGVFTFVKDEVASEQSKQAAPDPAPQPQQSIFGLGAIQEQVNAMLALQEPRAALERERNEVAMKRNNFERDREQFEKEKKEKLEELAELKKTYESGTARAKKGAELAFNSVLDKLLDDGEKGLSGTKAEVVDDEEQSKEHQLIESIAQNINEHFENGDIDEKGIVKVGAGVQKMINKIKEEA